MKQGIIPSMHEYLGPNCIGYVYSELGIIDSEKYVDRLSFKDVLKRFERASGFDSADIVAVISPTSSIEHMAIIDHALTGIRHRKGVDAPITQDVLEKGLEGYLKTDEYVMVYLKLKPKKKWGLF